MSHQCIGKKSSHDNVKNYNDKALLELHRIHLQPTWYAKTVSDTQYIPLRVRRWMRMVAHEVHERGLTP